MKILTPSPTMRISAIAAKKRMQGEQVYSFAAGDPVLENHPAILERAIRSTKKKSFPYAPVEGIVELRKLAAEWINATCRTQYSKENVSVTCGGKFGLFALIYSLLGFQDEVLIPAPYWVSYPDIVKMAGGVPKIIATTEENGWKMAPKNLVKQITKHSKMLILNNACNPTGVLYTKQELSEILSVAKDFGLTIISDEVYSGLVYEPPGFISCGSFSEYEDRVIIVQSCSKNFGMTGWRVGFVVGDIQVIARLAMLQSQSTTGVSLISQWAAVGALENADLVNSYVKEAMKIRRDLFMETYKNLFSTPIGEIKSALYAFPSLESMGIKEMSSADLCHNLIDSFNIALVPGCAFGKEGYLRLAFSELEDHIYQGLHQLQRAISTLGEVACVNM